MTTLDIFKEAVAALENTQQLPHGPLASPEERQLAGQACVTLCQGDQDKARTLWKLVAEDLARYMPRAAAVALIRAANTLNLVPDVEAPEVS